MLIYVDMAPVCIHRGMQVQHALLARDPDLHRAARGGRLIVRDEFGLRVGLEGSLTDGARLFTEVVDDP
jgi:hypothetical protein